MWDNVAKFEISLVMPNSYPRDGILNPNLTTIKDSYSIYCKQCRSRASGSTLFVGIPLMGPCHSSGYSKAFPGKGKFTYENVLKSVNPVNPLWKRDEPPHDDTNKMTCTQRRLQSALASALSEQGLRCPHEETLGPQLPIWAHNEDSDQTQADAQADLSLHWAYRPFCWFCHAVAHVTLK